MVQKYLGPPKFFAEVADRTQDPGVATGLAVTASGGDILFIESTRMKGQKGLTLTGSLGDVMKESAQAALSYIRSRADRLGISPDFYDNSDIHVHVPAGAIPKDGPSAGVTLATSLASLLTGRPCRPYVAMTGEITLRGKVLPVGGIKEKTWRRGVPVSRPSSCRDATSATSKKDIPEELRRELTMHFVDTVDEVLGYALRNGDETDQADEARRAHRAQLIG